MAVGQDVEGVDALGHQVLSVLDDLLIGALQDAGGAGDLAHEGTVGHAVLLEIIMDGGIVHGAHQDIETAVDGGLGGVQAGLLVVGDDLQEGGLAGGLHGGDQALHLVLGQAHVLEAPVLDIQVLAAVEHFISILHRNVIIGQHDDQIRFVSHNVLLLFAAKADQIYRADRNTGGCLGP